MGVYDPTGAPRIGKAKKVAKQTKKELPAFMQKKVMPAKAAAKKAVPMKKKGMK